MMRYLPSPCANVRNRRFGFRNWSAGAFAEYRTTGSLGRFEGFLAGLWSASFTVVGPECKRRIRQLINVQELTGVS
jgi:hypothetical protein